MKIKVVDHLSPEDVSMLQALYSRSAESVDVHLQKVEATGSGKFMERFYVGYGHKSIADCGSTTLFVEGVSLLAAKAIQDWPLYSGQETSTRFIDMSKQPIVDPLGTWGGSGAPQRVLRQWMAFYTDNQGRVAATICERYPRRPEQERVLFVREVEQWREAGWTDDKIDAELTKRYEGAVKARTFDILRGFLPAGITTQLSWHTNLRQAGDHLTLLGKHPAPEMREIAHGMEAALIERYTSSGIGLGLASVSGVGKTDDFARQERTRWEQNVADHYAYTSAPSQVDFGFDFSVRRAAITDHYEMLAHRPRGCVLPHFLSDLGSLSFAFGLDFGSFRDLQRHRNGVCRMPLLTTSLGFETWYLDQLDEGLREEAARLIEGQTRAIADLTSDAVVRQYYTALGYRVSCRVTYGLPAAVYVMELRSGKTVHPTLRRMTLRMVEEFCKEFPSVKLHVDTDPDDWTVRRGSQTIQER